MRVRYQLRSAATENKTQLWASRAKAKKKSRLVDYYRAEEEAQSTGKVNFYRTKLEILPSETDPWNLCF